MWREPVLERVPGPCPSACSAPEPAAEPENPPAALPEFPQVQELASLSEPSVSPRLEPVARPEQQVALPVGQVEPVLPAGQVPKAQVLPAGSHRRPMLPADPADPFPAFPGRQ